MPSYLSYRVQSYFLPLGLISHPPKNRCWRRREVHKDERKSPLIWQKNAIHLKKKKKTGLAVHLCNIPSCNFHPVCKLDTSWMIQTRYTQTEHWRKCFYFLLFTLTHIHGVVCASLKERRRQTADSAPVTTLSVATQGRAKYFIVC